MIIKVMIIKYDDHHNANIPALAIHQDHLVVLTGSLLAHPHPCKCPDFTIDLKVITIFMMTFSILSQTHSFLICFGQSRYLSTHLYQRLQASTDEHFLPNIRTWTVPGHHKPLSCFARSLWGRCMTGPDRNLQVKQPRNFPILCWFPLFFYTSYMGGLGARHSPNRP